MLYGRKPILKCESVMLSVAFERFMYDDWRKGWCDLLGKSLVIIFRHHSWALSFVFTPHVTQIIQDYCN
jgi:hypothetical protein